MNKNTSKHNWLIKTISIVLVCLVSFNNISFSLAPYLLLKQKLVVLSALLGGEVLKFCQSNPGLNVIGFAGYSGSGKTLGIEEVQRYLEEKTPKKVVVIKRDWFYKGSSNVKQIVTPFFENNEVYNTDNHFYDDEKYIEMLASIDRFRRSDDNELVIPLEGLATRKGIDGEANEPLVINKETVVLVEGTMILSEETEQFFDYSFFFELSFEEQMRRILHRESLRPEEERKSEEFMRKRVILHDRPNGDLNRALNLRRFNKVVENTDNPKIFDVMTVQKYGLEFTYSNGRIASINGIVGTDKEEVRAALIAISLKIKDVETIKTIIQVVNDSDEFFNKVEKNEIILEIEYNFELQQRRQGKEVYGVTNGQGEIDNSLAIDVSRDMKEIQTGEGAGDIILLIPLQQSEEKDTFAVAVNLSWIREFHYLNYWKKPLDEWCGKYLEEKSFTNKDLEQLKIWPIVLYDNPDLSVILGLSTGKMGDSFVEDSLLEKVSLSQLRGGLVFKSGESTRVLQYPEVLALIDGVGFNFPEVRRIGAFSPLIEGRTLEKNPDWFRSLVDSRTVWRGRTCPNCGGKESSVDTMVGPVRTVRCDDCGMGFTNPVVSLDTGGLDKYSTGKEYEKDKPKNIERARRNAAEFMKVLNREFPEMLHQPIIDVGCASGEMMKILRDDYGWPNENLVGVEPSEYAAQFARERYGLNVLAGTLETVNLEDKKFKGAFFFHSFEHIAVPLEALRKAHGLLEEDGIVGVLGVPNHKSLASFLHPERPIDRNFPDGQHVLAFNRSTLADMLKRAGFRITYAQDGISRNVENEIDDINAIALWIGWMFGVDVEAIGGNYQRLLGELEQIFKRINKDIQQKWGISYGFEIKDDDFKSIKNLMAFYDRVVWKSSFLFDIVLVWANKWEQEYKINFDLESIDREFSSKTHPDKVRETELNKVESSFWDSTQISNNALNIVLKHIDKPIDAHTNLSLISEKDLEENLLEWALIIKSCKDLPINFMFNSEDKDYESKAISRLKEIIPEMEDRVNVQQEGSLKLVIKHVKDMDKIGKDEYPVAMAGENTSNGNIAIRDFNAAVKIGLLQIVLKMSEHANGFQDLRDQIVKPTLKKLYEACGVMVEMSDEEINQIISDDTSRRITFAIKHALPPLCRFPVKALQAIHENNKMILEMA